MHKAIADKAPIVKDALVKGLDKLAEHSASATEVDAKAAEEEANKAEALKAKAEAQRAEATKVTPAKEDGSKDKELEGDLSKT